MKSDSIPRLRKFAGPNGSGKSTVRVALPHIFDNSGRKQIWIAEISGGTEIEINCDELSSWFKTTVWDNLGSDEA